MYQNIFLPSLLTSSNLTTSNLGLSKSICIAVQSTFHTYTSFPTKTLQTLLPVKTGGVGGVEERKEEARGGGRREVKVKEVEVVWEIRREDILGGGILMFLNLMWDKTMVLRNMDIRSARMKRSYIKRWNRLTDEKQWGRKASQWPIHKTKSLRALPPLLHETQLFKTKTNTHNQDRTSFKSTPIKLCV